MTEHPTKSVPRNPAITFFSLPIELRVMIYNHALIRPTPIILIEPDHPTGGSKLCPALLQTCKAIHQEAATILYSENIFMTQKPELRIELIQVLLERIGPLNIKSIKNVQLHIDNYDSDHW